MVEKIRDALKDVEEVKESLEEIFDDDIERFEVDKSTNGKLLERDNSEVDNTQEYDDDDEIIQDAKSGKKKKAKKAKKGKKVKRPGYGKKDVNSADNYTNGKQMERDNYEVDNTQENDDDDEIFEDAIEKDASPERRRRDKNRRRY